VHIAYPTRAGGPFDSPLDGMALLLVGLAALALLRYKVGVVQVIGGCALAGLVYKLLAAGLL